MNRKCLAYSPDARKKIDSDFIYFIKMQTAKSGKKDLIASELEFLYSL